MFNEEGLRDWFGKSKSKDGKKGWVNVVTGDSCASDKPGEGVPKCVSSSKRASMSKKERVAAQAAKRREDPGQQSKSGAAKPTNVKTDRKVRKEDMDINEARRPGESPMDYKKRVEKKYKGAKISKDYDPMKDPNFDHDKAERTRGSMQEAKDKKGKGSGSKDACYHKVKSRYSVWPSAYASGALVKCRKKGAANWGNSTKKEEFLALPEFSQLQIEAMRKNGIEVEVVDEACWKTHEQRGMKKKGGKMVPNCVPKGSVGEGYGMGQVDQKVGAVTSIPKDEQEAAKQRLLAKAAKKREMAQKIKEDRERIEEGMTQDEWNKKLEAAAAANQKRDKERGIKIHSTDSMKDVQDRIAARKKTQKEEYVDEGCGCDHPGDKKKKMKKKVEEERMPAQNGNVYMVTFSWRGKMMAMKIFFPETRRPSRQEVEAAMNKIYPGCKVRHFDDSYVGQGDGYLNVGKSDVYAEFGEGVDMFDPTGDRGDSNTKRTDKILDKKEKATPRRTASGLPLPPKPDNNKLRPGENYVQFAKRKKMGEEVEVEEAAAWTRKAGKNKEGGLNEKGRKSYERENPGSDLKAPSKKVGNPRRKSFCARMKGMKKKLTSKKTASDPDSRINKSLRAWNC
tara:strand:+ start:6646 stop:8511 length:1866 start_codon:yes stop_codon:yes gene_type:complete